MSAALTQKAKEIFEKVWINVEGEINGLFIDKRVEIKLSV
jgi:hypothetical protein